MMTDKNSAPQPVAWLAEYDGHTAVTTERDTMCQWRDTLGRKITPLAPISEGMRETAEDDCACGGGGVSGHDSLCPEGKWASRCKADFSALWCDSCNAHPIDCPYKKATALPSTDRRK